MNGLELYIFQAIVAPWFKNFIVPIAVLALTIFFKATSKTQISLERNDFFVCFDLCASAIFVFIIGMIDLANQILNPPNVQILDLIESMELSKSIDSQELETFSSLLQEENQAVLGKFALSSLVLLVILLTVFAISVLTRCKGWDASGSATLKYGIMIPNAIGLFLLIIATVWIRV